MNFSLEKIIVSIFQVSRDSERCLTISVRHFTLWYCSSLLHRLELLRQAQAKDGNSGH